MSRRETMVKRKLVLATEREVRVGVAKPRREKRVAEKYMREFWVELGFALVAAIPKLCSTDSETDSNFIYM